MTIADTYNSIRQLSVAVNRSKSTVGDWLQLPDWPFARSAPWPVTDAPKMVEWTDVNLRRDKSEDLARAMVSRKKNDRETATAGFWSMHPAEFGVPLSIPNHGHILPDADSMPTSVVSAAEFAIIDGDPLPSEDMIRDIIARNARFRLRMAALPAWLPGWLNGHDRNEITARMAAAINEPVEVFRDIIARSISESRKPARKAARR